ncbi:MAG: outer membrane lipoprotein carrier protein LolA [Gammaproteobacteria bacterium]|nr:MAG: outer membrane lipoprotein carrier protein LolA [Gammaproteobacteria bacterium]
MKINREKPLTVALSTVLISSMALSLSLTNRVQANELTAVSSKTQAAELVTIDAKSILMAKLAHLDFFSAKFNQQVLSDSGELLEQSSGELAISKPNLANWHTIEPDELAIVSDGQDVWFYNPWIEQVSVFSLSAAIAKTPILLLTSKDESLWQQYTVTQKKIIQKSTVTQQITNSDKISEIEDSFVISAIDDNSQIKSLTLIFDTKEQGGQLTQFSFLDATGQMSNIKLSDFNAQQKPAASLFKFVVPEGVQVDDQRAD